MNYEFYNFTKLGDATEDLKKLYAEGWRLITATTPFAIYSNIQSNNGTPVFYAVEYFLEKPKH